MNKIDVFIIAGGKCGSSTLRETFLKQSMNTIKSHNPMCFKNQFGFDGFFSTMLSSSNNRKLIIIDAYRMPIERKISSFFHNGEKKIPNFLKLSVEEQIILFNNEYLYEIENQHIIYDVYKHLKIPDKKKYDANRNYFIQKYNNLIIIKLFYNDIKNWGERLSQLLGINITMESDNMSSEKKYYNKYKQFLKQYSVPKQYLTSELPKDIEFKTFLSEKQQKEYITMWLKKCIE
jgi:hypothetical protein